MGVGVFDILFVGVCLIEEIPPFDRHPLISMDTDEERQIQEAIALSLAARPAVSSPMSEDAELRMALELSMQQPGASGAGPPPLNPSDDGLGHMDAAAAAQADAGGPALARLIFGEHPSGDVARQWRSQGLTIADVDVSDTPGMMPFGAGLAQDRGGPCAIMAAAQAFMLRRLLFGGPDMISSPTWQEDSPAGDGSLLPSESEAVDVLLSGLADILVRCSIMPGAVDLAAGSEAPPTSTPCSIVIALPTAGMLDGASSVLHLSNEELLAALTASAARPTGWEEAYQVLRTRREGLESPIGALAILVSALLTRGVGRFSEERDDASQPLLDSQFGHCSQEVLNLLLLGVGVSNVFDGSRDLGGGFMLRGGEHTPARHAPQTRTPAAHTCGPRRAIPLMQARARRRAQCLVGRRLGFSPS
jgi:hypothetical protein